MVKQDSRKPGAEYYSWEWTAVTGALLIVLGCVLIGTSYLATMVVSWLMGLVLLVSGIAQLIHAFRIHQIHGSVMRFMVATASTLAGIVILRVPSDGAMGITLILGFYLLFVAAAKGMLLFETNRNRTRAWLIVSSVISGALGVLLLATFPLSSLVIPGTILGVDLIFYGLFELTVSSKLRNRIHLVKNITFRKVA